LRGRVIGIAYADGQRTRAQDLVVAIASHAAGAALERIIRTQKKR